jgi:hypothetical protein
MTALSLIMLIFTMDLYGVSNIYIMKSKAATFEEINHPDIFLKQINGDLQCTLVAATMLVRRAAMLSGNLNWANITTDQIKQLAWIDGVGLKYTFTYEGITVSKTPFGSDPVNEALALLQQHPEGIVLFDQIRIPRSHAVLLTDYTNGMFYCADPSDAVPYGRIPINAGLVQVKDTEYYYYVTSPSIPSPTPSATEGNVILPITDINTYAAELSQTDYYYDGNEKKPVVSITGLIENVDYTVSYYNNVNLGTAVVIISGIGMYSGVMIKDFEIREATLYDYINEIKVGITKQTIQKGKTTTLKVALPQTLTLVKEYSNNVPSITNEVKINYKSANSKIATVTSKGKITGKKKGNTKITVTAALADGTKKVFTLTVKVK